MRILKLLLVLVCISGFAFAQEQGQDKQTPINKYRINFSEIEKNIENISQKLEVAQKTGDASFDVSQSTVDNFKVLLDLGFRMKRIVRHDSSEYTDAELKDFQSLLIDIEVGEELTSEMLDNLSSLLDIFQEMDIVYLNNKAAIKFIDRDDSRKDKKPYTNIRRIEELKPIIRAKGGVSSGGG